MTSFSICAANTANNVIIDYKTISFYLEEENCIFLL